MRPEPKFLPDAAIPVTPTAVAVSDMQIECVIFDAAGLPKRRRMMSLAAMLAPQRAKAMPRQIATGADI